MWEKKAYLKSHFLFYLHFHHVVFHKSNTHILTYRTVFVALNKTRFQSHINTTSFYCGDMSRILTPLQLYLSKYVCMRERSSASEV